MFSLSPAICTCSAWVIWRGRETREATQKCKKGEFYLLRAAYVHDGGRRQYVSTLNGEKHLVLPPPPPPPPLGWSKERGLRSNLQLLLPLSSLWKSPSSLLRIGSGDPRHSPLTVRKKRQNRDFCLLFCYHHSPPIKKVYFQRGSSNRISKIAPPNIWSVLRINSWRFHSRKSVGRRNEIWYFGCRVTYLDIFS